MKMSPKTERRKYRRVHLITQVECLARKLSSIGRTENLSDGGLLMLSPHTLDPNTEVTLRFNLPPTPPGRPIEAQGVVVRSQPGVDMGIRFLQLKDEDRNAINEFAQQSV